MLIGLLGPRGKLDRLSREEQLAVSCSLNEAEMVDVRRFVESLDLQPAPEAGIQAMVDKEGEQPLDASGPQGGPMQSQLKAWYSGLSCLSVHYLTSMCCSGVSVEEAEHL
eukprot:6188303-Amphidinium_carterae.1